MDITSRCGTNSIDLLGLAKQHFHNQCYRI